MRFVIVALFLCAMLATAAPAFAGEQDKKKSEEAATLEQERQAQPPAKPQGDPEASEKKPEKQEDR